MNIFNEMRIGPLFIFLISWFLGNSQTSVSGVISDTAGQAVSNVLVISKSSGNSTVTGTTGLFELKCTTPDTLILTAMGFQTLIVPIDHRPDESLHPIMINKSYQLPEARVSGQNKPVILTGRDSSTCVAYDFLEDKLLLAVYNYHDQKMRLILWDTLLQPLDSIIIDHPSPLKFIRACTGELMLITRHIGYQVAIVEGEITLLYPENAFRMAETLKPCVAAEDDIFYLGYLSADKLTQQYIKYFKDDSTWENWLIIDDDQERKNMADYDYLLAMKAGSGNAYDLDDALLFKELILKKPVYAPLFAINHRLYLFNHPGYRLEIYDESGGLQTEIPISYHLSSNWERMILMDSGSGRAFTIFRKNEQRKVVEIDITNGETHEILTLDISFAKDISVGGGWLYFLSRTRPTLPNTMLYRIRL